MYRALGERHFYISKVKELAHHRHMFKPEIINIPKIVRRLNLLNQHYALEPNSILAVLVIPRF